MTLNYTKITKQNTIFVQRSIESNYIVKLIFEEINSFPLPRFISNVSIFMEDVNWKVSIFLHELFWLI